MDAEVIFSKQLKQIEKEKRDKEVKLKSQEKKVWSVCEISSSIHSSLSFGRWTILSVPSVWWSCRCWSSNMKSSARRIGSSTWNKKTSR